LGQSLRLGATPYKSRALQINNFTTYNHRHELLASRFTTLHINNFTAYSHLPSAMSYWPLALRLYKSTTSRLIAISYQPSAICHPPLTIPFQLRFTTLRINNFTAQRDAQFLTYFCFFYFSSLLFTC